MTALYGSYHTANTKPDLCPTCISPSTPPRAFRSTARSWTNSATTSPRGHLAAGERLPSIHGRLAAELHINPTTIVKAYSELEHMGDIQMIHGKGAFVAAAAEPKSRSAIEREFRASAAVLAAAAVQMGVSAERAGTILSDEMARLVQEQRS